MTKMSLISSSSIRSQYFTMGVHQSTSPQPLVPYIVLFYFYVGYATRLTYIRHCYCELTENSGSGVAEGVG